MFSSHLDMAPFSMSHPSIFCKPAGNTLSCVETTQCAANEQRLLCLVGSVGSIDTSGQHRRERQCIQYRRYIQYGQYREHI